MEKMRATFIKEINVQQLSIASYSIPELRCPKRGLLKMNLLRVVHKQITLCFAQMFYLCNE